MGMVGRFEENRHWRLRFEFSRLLNEFTDLLEPEMVLEAITPVFMKLIQDPVEIIREKRYSSFLDVR